jgi:tetratricopeptide (TPR) repeat protein
MTRPCLWLLLLALALAAGQGAESLPLLDRSWLEQRTSHFHVYSCGQTQEVAKVTSRLEQFRGAYALMAGAQAVVSPPVIVLAFPDHAAMEPFLPVYQGKPANLAAFFHRGSDENLIVLSLEESGGGSLESVFHEFTHLLLRRYGYAWPLWLQEGMADIYATFEVTGSQSVSIGKPPTHHLHELGQKPLLPLATLFAVGHDSPEYNERERQGIFYAESWLLTHYLMLGSDPAHKAAFARFKALLLLGQGQEGAFTNAFGISLTRMETELQKYLQKGKFQPLRIGLTANLPPDVASFTRRLSPAEVCFRLGDEQLRVGQPENAESYFLRAQKFDPKSPLSFEGLGLLAAEREQPEQAAQLLGEAVKRGSTSFLAYYVYARAKYRITSNPPDHYSRLEKGEAVLIRSNLQQSLELMPDFGPAHHLLGFFELVQSDDLNSAERHLKAAIMLEPENQAYPLSLAQAQLLRHESEAARRTLEALSLPSVEPKIRAQARELLKETGHPGS